MKRITLACLSAALVFAACGDDGGTTNPTDTVTGDTSSPADTTVADTTQPPAGTSAITGVSSVGVTCDEPTRNGECANPIATGQGFEYPWCGFEIPAANSHTNTAYDFTCNTCPNGLDGFQGVYRNVGSADGGDTYDADLPDPNSYAETVAIDGNTFKVHIRDAGGGDLYEVEYSGWFFCTDAAELTSRHLFWVITDTTIGSTSKGAVESNFIGSSAFQNDVVVVEWFPHDKLAVPNNACGGDFPCHPWYYCKVGGELDEKPCVDPFTLID